MKLFTPKLNLLVLAAIFAVITQVQAAETITVKGNANKKASQKDSGTSEVLVKKKEMDKRISRQTADLIEQVTGVTTVANPNSPELVINIRGLQDYGRVNMSVENMRQNFQISGYQEYNGHMYIDSELVSGIKFSKGANSRLGGASVSGGVVNFNLIDFADILTKPEKNWGGYLRGAAGNNGQKFAGSLAFAKQFNDKFSAMAAVAYRKVDDYYTGDKGTTFYGRLDPNIMKTAVIPEVRIPKVKTKGVGQDMRSVLLRARYKPADEHEFKLSYYQLSTLFSNPSNLQFGVEPGRLSDKIITEKLFRKSLQDDVFSNNISLDYKYTPDNDWVNLQSKLYRTYTQSERTFFATTKDYLVGIAPFDSKYANQLTSFQANCEQDSSFRKANYFLVHGKLCNDSLVKFATTTIGFNLENQSFVKLSDNSKLLINTGVEIIHDKTKPEDNFSFGSVMGMSATPPGDRLLSSLFVDALYSYKDWLKINVGARYDHLSLKGTATADFTYGGMFFEVPGIPDSMIGNLYTKQINRNNGKLSPTLSISLQPFDALELYAKYQTSWRAPGITESMYFGVTPQFEDTNITIIPSPFLKPETTKGFELGANLRFTDIWLPQDSLSIGISHYRNKLNDQIQMVWGVSGPGDDKDIPFGSGNRAGYVNQIHATKINGTELSIKYDAQKFYLAATASQIKIKEKLGHRTWLWEDVPYDTSLSIYCSGAYGWADYPVVADVCKNGAVPYNDAFAIRIGGPPPKATKASINIGTRQFDNKLDLGLIWNYHGSAKYYQEEIADGMNFFAYLARPADMPSHQIWDAYVNYKVTENLKLGLKVTNITDQSYAFTKSFGLALQPGRTWVGSVEYRF